MQLLRLLLLRPGDEEHQPQQGVPRVHARLQRGGLPSKERVFWFEENVNNILLYSGNRFRRQRRKSTWSRNARKEGCVHRVLYKKVILYRNTSIFLAGWIPDSGGQEAEQELGAGGHNWRACKKTSGKTMFCTFSNKIDFFGRLGEPRSETVPPRGPRYVV